MWNSKLGSSDLCSDLLARACFSCGQAIPLTPDTLLSRRLDARKKGPAFASACADSATHGSGAVVTTSAAWFFGAAVALTGRTLDFCDLTAINGIAKALRDFLVDSYLFYLLVWPRPAGRELLF